MPEKTLIAIPVGEISQNPHNPRLIFDQDEMDELKGSIGKVGILVPLTVYRNTKAYPKTSYVLLDGERRWRCAKELEMASVPANVIDEPKDVTQNILFMFNIHHYRRDWELFPTALKLEQLMEALDTQQESVISNFTGVPRTLVRRCKTLLWFPKKFRNVLMERDTKVSTDFFIEIYPIVRRLSFEDEYPFPSGVEQLTDALIAKFLSGRALTDVKEFRDIRRALSFWDKKSDLTEFKNRLQSFLHDPAITLDVFDIAQEDERIATMLLKHTSVVYRILNESDPDALSNPQVLEELKRLSLKIKSILDEID